MKKWRRVLTGLNLVRALLPWIFLHTNRFSQKCMMDLNEWIRHTPELQGKSRFWMFCYLLVTFKECRNILLNRLHRNPVMYVITRLLFQPLESCYINMPPEDIGGGFSLQHGFSSIITARKIGENCRIFQQVTVGYNGPYAPVIGDRVTIAAGAIVIGNVHVENDAYIGAGAVVTHDVKEKSIVAGVPARVIRMQQ